MKKIYTFIILAMFGMNVAVAQNGTSCGTAVQINSNSTCLYSSHVISGTEYWLKFTVANTTYVNIEVITTKFSINAPHVHGIFLYDSCGNPVAIASDELAFFSSADRLAIDLDASNLIIGNSYFIKLTREATGDVKCDKIDCFPVVSPAAFDICIEEVDVLIPVDLQAESPAISHTYYQQRGQLLHTDGTPASEVKMYTFSANPAVYIGEGFVSFVKARIDNVASTIDTMHRVDMKLVGMELIPKVFKTERVPGFVNHFLPHIPKGVTGTKGFSRAVSNDVYPNIDVQYYSNNEGVKFYFVVRPGGDAEQITMRFDGATSTGITPTQFGDGLQIETLLGDIVFEKAHVYRKHPTNNATVPMPASGDFVQVGVNEYKFDIGNYPGSWTLVIGVDEGHSINTATEPEYSSYLGDILDDFGYAVDADIEGNSYLTGMTRSPDFPVSAGAYIDTLQGQTDAWAGMFTKKYERKWLSYIGGPGYDRGLAVDFDNGRVFFTGVTESGVPVLPEPGFYQQNQPYSNCAYISFFDTTFGLPQWISHFGGTWTIPNAIEVDFDGNIYLAGTVAENNTVYCAAPSGAPPRFPVCNPGGGAYYQDYNASPGAGYDGFFTKFDNTGALVHSTFFGGEGNDFIKDIVIDGAGGAIYLVGITHSDMSNTAPPCAAPLETDKSFPLCQKPGAYFQPFFNRDINTPPNIGNSDGFLTELSFSGILLSSTYIGGGSNDGCTSIAINSIGEVILTGFSDTATVGTGPTCIPTNEFGFPFCASGNEYSQTPAGLMDNFVMHFDTSDWMVYASWVGGSENEGRGVIDQILGEAGGSGNPSIAIDSDDNIFIYGTTASTNMPVANSFGLYNQPNSGGGRDAYIFGLNPGNELIYGSYYGGGGDDEGTNLAISGNQRLYITGNTKSPTNFPLRVPGAGAYFQPACAGCSTNKSDAFVAQINMVGVPLPVEESSIEPDDELLIYPNPASDKLTLELNIEGKKDIAIGIYNILGSLIMDEKLYNISGSYKWQADFSGLANGVYLVKVSVGEKGYNHKVVKQH